MKDGDRVGSEEELIGRLGVARSSVREALRILESYGVVQLLRGQRGGATWREPQSEQIARSLAMILQWRGATLRTLLDTRRIIEPSIAAEAARCRTAVDLTRLRSCLDDLKAWGGDDTKAQRATALFHNLVAEASGNQLISALSQAISWMTASFPHPSGSTRHPPAWNRLIRQQASLAQAIEMQDGTLAARRMERMLTATIRELEQRSPETLAAPVVWPDVDELIDELIEDATAERRKRTGQRTGAG
jgi:GntR family transcriptional regulator, transcriptional repressor for pyruvate dehydrogenase complex